MSKTQWEWEYGLELNNGWKKIEGITFDYRKDIDFNLDEVLVGFALKGYNYAYWETQPIDWSSVEFTFKSIITLYPSNRLPTKEEREKKIYYDLTLIKKMIDLIKKGENK